jgi:enamine deaminase RidA (YjgF/YER057c/UK114 family)
MAHAVAVRHLVEAVLRRDGADLYWLKQDIVLRRSHRKLPFQLPSLAAAARTTPTITPPCPHSPTAPLSDIFHLINNQSKYGNWLQISNSHPRARRLVANVQRNDRMTAKVAFWNPRSAIPPFGPYSLVAGVSPAAELLFLSGQVGVRADGSVPATVEEQYELAIRSIRDLLIESGSSPANIVKLSTYVVTPIDPAKLKQIRTEVLGDIRPAATMYYVPRLLSDELLVEVEAIGVR